MRHRGDVRHRVVFRVDGEPAEMRQRDERLERRRGDREVAVVEVEPEEAVEADQRPPTRDR